MSDLQRQSAPGVQTSTKSFAKALGSYGFIPIFLAILAIYVIKNQGAITWNGVMNILRHSTQVGIIGLGMGLVIITGGIDLSVGSMMALIGGLSVMVFNATNNTLLTLLFAIACGSVCGFINGFLVGKVKLPAFIVTLATMMIFRSISQYLLNAVWRQSIYNMNATLSSYEGFYGFGQQMVFSVPVVGLVLIGMTLLFVFVSTSTKFGKTVYAIGSNEKAARLAGINVDWVRVSVFVITGMLCGISTFLFMAMNGSVDAARIGDSFEMYAIAAVVIGGISMSGGKGKLLGVLFGAMSYFLVDKIIASLRMDALINNAVKGSILLVAVLVQILIPIIRGKLKKAGD